MARLPPRDEPEPEPEPVFYIQVNEAQCHELSMGRLPELVQDLARTLMDFETEAQLRQNAAKPVRIMKGSKR